MSIRISDVQGLVMVGFIYLMVLNAVVWSIAKSVLTLRRVERAYRIRLAHWRAATESRSG